VRIDAVVRNAYLDGHDGLYARMHITGMTTAVSARVAMRPPCASPEKPSVGTRRPFAPLEPSPAGTRQGAAWCAIAALAALVDDAAVLLESRSETGAAARLVPSCHAAMEACLELLRDAGERDVLVRNATDDLKRLMKLLKLVDGSDTAFFLREIRLVLGRFDACGGHLVIDRDG
jgi:hypothetical protein